MENRAKQKNETKALNAPVWCPRRWTLSAPVRLKMTGWRILLWGTPVNE
tara:strand:- start:85 stop:231 length:147 start_codon:yes stop_codon:yes gene_type:complete